MCGMILATDPQDPVDGCVVQQEDVSEVLARAIVTARYIYIIGSSWTRLPFGEGEVSWTVVVAVEAGGTKLWW